VDLTNYLNLKIDLLTGNVHLTKDLLTGGNYGPLLEYFESGEISSMISLNQLYNILKEGVEKEYSSPILPYGTVFYNEKDSYTIFFVKFNETVFPFEHRDYPELKNNRCYFPDSFFAFVIPTESLQGKSEKIPLTKSFILISENPLEDFSITKIYKKSPLPNFNNTYSTGICWGSSSSASGEWTKNIKSLSSLSGALSRYLHSEFNSDLSPSFDSHDRLLESIRNFLRDQELTLAYGEFLVSKKLVSEETSTETAYNELRRRKGVLGIFYSFLCFYAEKKNSFPAFLIKDFPSYNVSVSEIIQNPIRGY
jgi:hypothetical protein